MLTLKYDADTEKRVLTEEARQEGLQEGLQEGELKKAKDIAKNLLFLRLPIEQIMQVTGLSSEEIKRLN